MIELIIAGDMTMDEIAASVKKTRKTIYNWLNNPLFKGELEERRSQIEKTYKARLSLNAGIAIKRAKEILENGEDEKAVVSMIADTLDRAGYPKLKASDLKKEEQTRSGGVVFIPELMEADDGSEQD